MIRGNMIGRNVEKRTLFISDLDGTLLGKRAEITERSAEILNELLDRGLLFTAASARTPLSAVPILGKLRLSLPVILLNGAMLYDRKEHRVMETVEFGKTAVECLAEAEREAGLCGLILSEENRIIKLNRGPVEPSLWEAYFRLEDLEETEAVQKQFLNCRAGDLVSERCVYGLYMDSGPGRLARMKEILEEGQEFTLDFYKDIYTENRWCLEIFSSKASKGSAVGKLKEICRADRAVAFGDGSNDVPLFHACEEKVAVANAWEPLKHMADRVIGSNLEDAVAFYLKERCRNL